MRLRSAERADAYALWLWANDPVTREASGARPVIDWAGHIDWFDRRLRSSSALIYIGENANEQPIGAIRFESQDGWRTAVLSYVVAPEVRGRGFGRALLVEGVEAVRAVHPGLVLTAEVATGNTRSTRLFEFLGWEELTPVGGRRQFADRRAASV